MPVGTASRLTTGVVPGTGRPGTRSGTAGVGMALLSQIQVTDRPVTQQGLRGPRTAANKGNQRMVQDKTYFLGVLRNKVNDLTSEIGRLKAETDTVSTEQANFVTYEKRAESLAQELEDLRAELGDYNTLVDKINTETSISEMHAEVNELRSQNDREANQLDVLFEQKQQRETVMKQLETELNQEKNLAETVIADMDDAMRGKYRKLKDENEKFLKCLEEGQQQLDALNIRKEDFEKQIMESHVKQEAVKLYETLRHVEMKRDQLMIEMQSTLTPQEEKEKLLKQVKEDNAEIAAMERQTKELQERMEQLQDESNQLDLELDMNQGERSKQARELKMKFESINEFFETFDQNKDSEMTKMQKLQMAIVQHLEQTSRNLTRTSGQSLPTPEEFEKIKDDLIFKEKEMVNSENTTSALSIENRKLQGNLKNLEDLESKMTQELQTLKSKMDSMSNEIETFSDLDKLKRNMDDKRRKLEENKVQLHRKREEAKTMLQNLKKQSDEIKQKLEQNETHIQLLNLERKWQHLEQSNYVMKDFIASKMKDCDYTETSRKVALLVADYNKLLINEQPGAGRK